MFNNDSVRLPPNAVNHILSYLEPTEVNAFRLTCKANYDFCKKHKEKIEYNIFLKKIVNDPVVCQYLHQNEEVNPRLQKALVAYVSRGEVLKEENGYPIIRGLIDKYFEYRNVKNNIKNERCVKHVIPVDGGYSHTRSKCGFLYMASGARSNLIKVLDIKNKKVWPLDHVTPPYNGHVSGVKQFEFGDRNKLYSSSADRIVLHDLNSKGITNVFAKDGLSLECFTVDKDKLYVAYENETISIFDVEKNEEINNFNTDNPDCWSIRKINDSIITFSGFKVVKFWDVNNFNCKKIIYLKGVFLYIPVPLVDNFIFSRFDSDKILIFDIKEDKEIGCVRTREQSTLRIKNFGNLFFFFFGRREIKEVAIWNINNPEKLDYFELFNQELDDLVLRLHDNCRINTENRDVITIDDYSP